MERDEYAPGMPSWVDLGSPDIDGAADFYSGLFGWEATEPGPVEETGGYRMFEYKGRPVAGLGPQTNPGPPYWTTYVTVADADATVAKAEEAGGRMAVFADPTGAAIAIWQPGTHPGAGLVSEPNTMCWNELSTRDVPAATEFYGQVFGWTAVPQGPYNEWQLDGTTVGGMMQTPDMVPAEVPAHWLVYFAVEDTDAAVARAQELGGSVVVPPMDIQPGRFATLTDPTGAMFAVITLKAGLGA
jgi:predicted enzyme related to lactoylglutathione lyase